MLPRVDNKLLDTRLTLSFSFFPNAIGLACAFAKLLCELERLETRAQHLLCLVGAFLHFFNSSTVFWNTFCVFVHLQLSLKIPGSPAHRRSPMQHVLKMDLLSRQRHISKKCPSYTFPFSSIWISSAKLVEGSIVGKLVCINQSISARNTRRTSYSEIPKHFYERWEGCFSRMILSSSFLSATCTWTWDQKHKTPFSARREHSLCASVYYIVKMKKLARNISHKPQNIRAPLTNAILDRAWGRYS